MSLDLTTAPTADDRAHAIAVLRWYEYERYTSDVAEVRARQATAAAPAILRSEALAREGLAFRADAATLARSAFLLATIGGAPRRPLAEDLG